MHEDQPRAGGEYRDFLLRGGRRSNGDLGQQQVSQRQTSAESHRTSIPGLIFFRSAENIRTPTLPKSGLSISDQSRIALPPEISSKRRAKGALVITSHYLAALGPIRDLKIPRDYY